jgi:hypothetical protein
MAERNKRAKITESIADQTVTYQPYVAGSDQLDGRTFVAELGKLSTDIQTRLALSRLRNKLMDSYSDKTTDVIERVTDTFAMLENGDWDSRGEGADRTSVFIEAYANVYKKPIDAVRTAVNNLATAAENGDADADKKLKAARADQHVKLEMANIAARRAAERQAKLAEGMTGQAPSEATVDLLA